MSNIPILTIKLGQQCCCQESCPEHSLAWCRGENGRIAFGENGRPSN